MASALARSKSGEPQSDCERRASPGSPLSAAFALARLGSCCRTRIALPRSILISDHDVGMTVAVFYLDQASERGARADVIVLLDAADPAHADVIAEARSLGMTVSPSATFTGGTERERVLNAFTREGIECIAVHAHRLEGRRAW